MKILRKPCYLICVALTINNGKCSFTGNLEEENIDLKQTTNILFQEAKEANLESDEILGKWPTIGSRLFDLIKNKALGWPNAIRAGYDSYQAIMPSGNIGGTRPETYEQGMLWIKNIFESVENTGVFNHWVSNRMTLINLHEFAANGEIINTVRDGRQVNDIKYSAASPLEVEAWEGIIDGASDYLKDKPQGLGLLIGGFAIHLKTIVDDYGNEVKIGENRGAVLAAQDPTAISFTKPKSFIADGWESEYVVPAPDGLGYENILLSKFIPNNQEVMTVAICGMAQEIKSFPETSSIINITGAGLPYTKDIAPSNIASEKLLCDVSQVEDLSVGSSPYLDGRTGLYVYTGEGHTYLSQLFKLGADFWSITSGQVQEGLVWFKKMGQSRFVFSGEEGETSKGTIIITNPREIPSLMSQDTLLKLQEQLVNQQSPVIDPRNDPLPNEQLNDPLGESLEQQFEANKDFIDRVSDDFGGTQEEIKL